MTVFPQGVSNAFKEKCGTIAVLMRGIIFEHNRQRLSMNKTFLLLTGFLWILFLISCSKKTHPAKTPGITEITADTPAENPKTDSAVKKEPVIKAKPKASFPKVISVNDSAARKSVDGRYYYDVMGHRYWRNNKDGKYYLFDKSMYKNDEFKNPGQ